MSTIFERKEFKDSSSGIWAFIPTSMEIGVCKLEYHDFSMD